MNPEQLNLQSADGAQLNIDALYRTLYQIAPSCFTETKGADGKVRKAINFDVLRQLLGDAAADTGDEFYQFTWPGKAEARREAARPIKKTLRPVKEDSVDWDTTQNLYIEGDNLEVLKLLQKSYLGKVKMIYIDPPYNTGNDFVYDDDFSQSANEYAEASGDVDELGQRYRKNTDSNGRFHSDWCSMIYPRLQIARSLLAEDGVIFISIDDNEVRNLKNICDEIFGEMNFVGNFQWKKKGTTSNVEGAEVSSLSDSTLCYKKSNVAKINPRVKASSERNYPYSDSEGNYRTTVIEKKDSGAYRRDSMKFEILGHKPREGKRWQIGEDKARLLEAANRFIYDGEKILLKIYDFEDKDTTSAQPTLLENVGSTDSAAKLVNVELFGVPELFDNPKPIELLKHLANIASNKDSLILDFFSGSATTAHAVMQLNAEDGGNRRFIMVQLPEETDDNSEARKAGYANICEIGKERIRRAGKKVKEEAGLNGQDLDIGFRVFRVDESNMEDVYFAPKSYSQDKLDMFIDNVKADRTDLDLLFGAMLDWGVQLSLPMATTTVKSERGKVKSETMVYVVNEGDLVACFARDISEEVIDFIAEQSPLRVLLRDSCFSSDADKINIFEQFKQRLGWSDEEAYKNIRVI